MPNEKAMIMYHDSKWNGDINVSQDIFSELSTIGMQTPFRNKSNGGKNSIKGSLSMFLDKAATARCALLKNTSPTIPNNKD